MTPPPSTSLADRLGAGFRNLTWKNVLLLAAANAAIALALWIEDTRTFWHPFITAQGFGFVIAYCVRVASPWDHPTPIRRLTGAVAVGAVLALVLVAFIKRYTIDAGYTIDYAIQHWKGFALTACTAFVLGLLASLMVQVRLREARAKEELHRTETERHLLSKQAVEAELKLMQAQVEPHFLFNTLASVQYLTETDPPQASQLLGHLIELPACGAAAAAQRFDDAGPGNRPLHGVPQYPADADGATARLQHRRPRSAAELSFPPMLLISVVENAVTHGLEPLAAGGHIEIAARRDGDRLQVTVSDTGARTHRRFTPPSRRGPRQRPRTARGAVRRARTIHARGCDATRCAGDDRDSDRSRDARRCDRGGYRDLSPCRPR